jgi:hypothetical protein
MALYDRRARHDDDQEFVAVNPIFATPDFDRVPKRKLPRQPMLRVVVRNGFSRDLADLLLRDLERLIPELERTGRRLGREATSFHH